MSRWIVTGGAGFIGSHFVRTALLNDWVDQVDVIDSLTYAGNLKNLAQVKNHPGLRFHRVDICDVAQVEQIFGDGASAVFHFAAESHVDRSIKSAAEFVRTNVVGTQVLLDSARTRGVERFVHVSTDEVYGSLELDTSDRFTENSAVNPTSPYAASKAASDMLVVATHRTHKLDTIITRCSNNYGPYQFPEKFLPLFITNCFEKKHLPLYGDGKNVRDWIHIDDHILGIKLAYERGRTGEVYNLGGNCERTNKYIAEKICDVVGAPRDLIRPVTDRKAHDKRYAIDATRAKRELGFVPGLPIERRLEALVQWYREHKAWWLETKTGDFYRQSSIRDRAN